MPRLSQRQRIDALMMLSRGDPIDNVARAFNCHRNTIRSLRVRFQQTGAVSDRPRTGRPRVTDVRLDRHLELTHTRRRFQTATETARQYGISRDTVLRRLRHCNRPIRPRRPYVGSILTRRHRNARLNWARQHLRWQRRQWNEIVFTDESRFNLSTNDGRIRVFRRRGERFVDACVVERNRFGGGSVMVWGGIMGHRKTDLVIVNGNLNAAEYINQVLRHVAVPFINQHAPATLMHDNARPHTARLTQQYLTANHVDVLPWPAVSPDMNPIEHIWDLLGRRVRSRHNVSNLQELENALQIEWNNITPRVVQRYVNSMRRRIVQVIRNNGGHTRY